MLRERQARGIMWAAGISMGFAAAVSWWSALAKGSMGADLVAPIAFTVSALIWITNVLVARATAMEEVNGGHTR